MSCGRLISWVFPGFPALALCTFGTETFFVLCVVASLAPSLAFNHNLPLVTAPHVTTKCLGRCPLGAKLIALVKTTGPAGV